MADERSLETRITSAERTLNGAFGIKQDLEGEGANKFLDKEVLSEAYKKEASRKEITKQFLSMAKSIRNMRSSYLPVDFFLNTSGGLTLDVESNIAKKESYENTFMRMLGMPAVGSREFGLTKEDSEIRASESIKTIDPNTGEVIEKPYEEIRDSILAERRLTKKERRYLIDNSIYNISDGTASELSGNTISIRSLSPEEKASLLGLEIEGGDFFFNKSKLHSVPTELTRENENSSFGTVIETDAGEFQVLISTTQTEALLVSPSEKETQANIQKISQDVWKFAYLLIPPIQDIEITRCINETSKLVAPPFSNTRSRKVNNNEVRPTLIESVIRIRLDKVSGTNSFFEPQEEEDALFKIEIGKEKQDVRSDDFGILESLFILRLRSAISGLAKKAILDIDVIINEMEKTRQIPATEVTVQGAGTAQEVITESIEAAAPSTGLDSLIEVLSTAEAADDAAAIAKEKQKTLEQQKLIEESMMFLLGDNSEVLDLQAQTQRSSSIYNSHMMSGLIDIVDVPRKRINEELTSLIEKKNQGFSGPVEQKMQSIGTTLGTDIGIGTLDLAVFSLALFTISEDSLLGLLSNAQFDRIKNGEFSALIPEGQQKAKTVESLNEFTQLIIDGYRFFIQQLEIDGRPDRA